ncbi:hypothetical protein ASPFODRAFT_481427 [Aspergillus luchuensis CBS 106.47]|uniref:Uncharacterized protein n=1 Tax=Aspergillus luchuensis (strain CBS 106.47) TaxID=1137211 RepID=A0A1M3TR37_ASPLC|nr:hypothetical protein ASPFODRAFT_481427 [Aspergillus luchuensis CBS 106.47]
MAGGRGRRSPRQKNVPVRAAGEAPNNNHLNLLRADPSDSDAILRLGTSCNAQLADCDYTPTL